MFWRLCKPGGAPGGVTDDKLKTNRLTRTPKLFLARWVTPIFVAFDIAALFLQLVGAVMITSTDLSDANYRQKVLKGKDIALSGVSVQIAAFGLFSIIAVRFHIVAKRFKADLQRRLQPVPGEKFVTVEGIEGRKLRPNWEMLLYAINISCALIMVSSTTNNPLPSQKKSERTPRRGGAGFSDDGFQAAPR